MTSVLAPALLERGTGALDRLGPAAAHLGRRALLVHGGAGLAAASPRLGASLAAAGVSAVLHAHEGPPTASAFERVDAAASSAGAQLVIGVGGGRTLDVAKGGALARRLPFVALPTSPATCAAVTAMAIAYTDAYVWAGPVYGRTAPELVVLDPEVLAAAPDRLLAAGVLDAWAKVEEVRLAARHARRDPFLAGALGLCDALAGQCSPDAPGLADGLPRGADARAALAEAVVVLPGVIAGLAGEGNKVAAAHAVHNAFTLLPEHERSLHGELVAFGVLVQQALDGAVDADLARATAWMGRLGVRVTLGALGIDGWTARRDELVARVLAAPAMARAFPAIVAADVVHAVERVAALAAA